MHKIYNYTMNEYSIKLKKYQKLRNPSISTLENVSLLMIYYVQTLEVMYILEKFTKGSVIMKKIDRLFVNSEIGKLKKVLLHRPGKEIENLTPGLMDRLLFDDIPYLKVAREEHDYFANVLRESGAE